MKKFVLFPIVLFLCSVAAFAQVPLATQVQILKAEDERRYDSVLENLMTSPNAAVRERAVLAAGRIGDERAVPALVNLLRNDTSENVKEMAAFALGETESIEAADAVLGELRAAQAETRPVGSVPGGRLSTASMVYSGPLGTLANARVSARLVEAAGKIAAANAKDDRAKALGEAVANVLKKELESKASPRTAVIRLGLTAVLRARPAGAEETVRMFLAYTDPAIVADALNTLARLRAKNANRDARDLLATNPSPIVRANAARVLGAAEDKEAVDVLIRAATSDKDERVRVSAIRSLAAIKDTKAVEPLLDRGDVLIAAYKAKAKPAFIPAEQSEFIEVATALGRLIPNSNSERAVGMIREFGKIDQGRSLEVYIATVRIAPRPGDGDKSGLQTWRQLSSLAQVVGEFAALEPTSEEGKKMKAEAPGKLHPLAAAYAEADPKQEGEKMKAGPDVLRAYAAFKPDDLDEVLRTALKNKDVFVRATAAELLGERPRTPGVIVDLSRAFESALQTDKHDNDAQLAILDAMAKIDIASSVDTIYKALDATDYLVRKRAFDLLDNADLLRRYPAAVSVVQSARAAGKDRVRKYDPKSGTKLGQVLNTDADYRRALSRKNGTVKAVITTQKGTFTIDLLPEDAPLTVDNFVKLARSGYFNGLEVHRVVPNFVMQDGDPRGDGSGGPGWSIRCEVNMVPYERGAVGMALSGKDTGGSQWFVTHSPQPHLDGGYTVFGRVNETGMKVVDRIVRGDKIVAIRIVGI
jgi:cyclophilin family peptidyl-prolyl cis-trans isomerase/HEAT repeat protein